MGEPGFDLVDDGGGRYRIGGELDMSVADRLTEEIPVLPGRDLSFDCSRLRFVDSAGIRALLRISKAIEPGSLRLEGVGDSVAIVFDLVRMKDVPNVTVTPA